MKIFRLFNFDLINVLPQKTHGGSMRYVVGRSNNIRNECFKVVDTKKEKY